MKRVLVPLLGDAGDQPALQTVARLAVTAGARVDVVFMHRDPIDMIPLAGDGYGASMITQILKQAEDEVAGRRKTAEAAFAAWQKEANGLEARFSELVGIPDASVARLGRIADLIVLARNSDDQGPNRQALIDAAVSDSGRPVLLAATLPQETIGKRIVLAWNGSAEAARAVAMARPFFSAADHVVVVGIDESAKTDVGTEALAETLVANGFDVGAVSVPEGESGVADTLLDQAYAYKTDMIVIGAYSHSRMRERIFGGVTRDLIENVAWPVLLAG